ncbi:hypothetical protein Nepgr_019652 [Nepenthes gracilis]|uniref:Uncharacterized protein n=1 Tax=Nepenthes gracilis TaxID=150966 RepID=A0AAD3SXH2_NEPGR|nr:hypothetical protein Nepgr_019652 [Nepenthes gracilis]
MRKSWSDGAPPTAVESSGATPRADVPLPHFEVEVSVVPVREAQPSETCEEASLRDVAGKIASKMEDLRTANEVAQRTVTELAEPSTQ